MLVAERRKKIIEIVNDRKSIRVTELSKIFSVTEETIRRDLEKLERDNQLVRSHGGALSVTKSDTTEIPYFEREITNMDEKKAIADEAVKFISEGDKIFLDASTTAWYMAKALPDVPLTVVTNSIKVTLELAAKTNIKVISTGGELLRKSLSFIGYGTEGAIDSYHVDKAFISCKALHPTFGLSESDEQQAVVKSKMINSASKSYIMVDYSKFGLRSFSCIGSVKLVDTIITDSKMSEEAIDFFEERAIPVVRPEVGE